MAADWIKTRQTKYGAYVTTYVLIMLAVTAVPFVFTIGLAFTNYNLVATAWKFTGFENFSRLFHEAEARVRTKVSDLCRRFPIY